MDVVYLPLTCFLEAFEQPTCGWPTCDCFYLPDHAWWTLERVVLIPGRGFVLVLVVISGPTRFPLFHEPLQFPFSYEFLYLLL